MSIGGVVFEDEEKRDEVERNSRLDSLIKGELWVGGMR